MLPVIDAAAVVLMETEPVDLTLPPAIRKSKLTVISAPLVDTEAFNVALVLEMLVAAKVVAVGVGIVGSGSVGSSGPPGVASERAACKSIRGTVKPLVSTTGTPVSCNRSTV